MVSAFSSKLAETTEEFDRTIKSLAMLRDVLVLRQAAGFPCGDANLGKSKRP